MVKKTNEDEALQNRLLGALPEAEFKKIRPLLKEVDLAQDEVLWEIDEKCRLVYFATTAMICVLYDADEGVSIEVGMTGRQGMVGVVTFIGDARMAKRAVVQREGKAFRMRAEDVEKEFATCPDFQDICMCYTQTLIAQISQNVICNRLHSVEQQLCRYLLVNYDNLLTESFAMTQEQISNVLGVRRESVSIAATELKDRGLIDYSRGQIEVLDREGLLSSACECYEVVRDQYDRILGKYIKVHSS